MNVIVFEVLILAVSIIGAIINYNVFCVSRKRFNAEKSKKRFDFVNRVLYVLLFIMFILIMSFLCFHRIETTVDKNFTSEIPIYSFEDNSEIYCRYNNKPEFIQYFADSDNGGKVIRKVEAKDSTFFNVDDNYRIITYKANKISKFLFLSYKTEYNVYEFYIPKGSIANLN